MALAQLAGERAQPTVMRIMQMRYGLCKYGGVRNFCRGMITTEKHTVECDQSIKRKYRGVHTELGGVCMMIAFAV
jgi:hypothetical protein